MKVLYIGIREILHLWYQPVLDACAGRFDIHLYDPERPIEEQLEGVEVLIEQGGAIGRRHIIDEAKAAGVKLWQVLGTGLDHVDVDYILSKGLPLANTPGQFSAVALAEHAMYQMLHFAKQHDLMLETLRQGKYSEPMNEELETKTLCMVGFGASARELARRAWAFGMRMLALDQIDVPEGTVEEYHLEFCGKPADLERLASEADYLSLHVPLTSKTRHMINRQVLAKMKPTAVLVNVARGELVDEDALLETLKAGQIRGAALDVFTSEPIDPKHPLVQLDSVLATPHTAGVTNGTARRRAEAAIENLARVAAGQSPLYQVTSSE